MKVLITGGCGFLGSNLAAEVIQRGDELFVFDNLFRVGSEENLKWLRQLGKFTFFHSDIRLYNDVEYVICKVKPDVIFHLSGQVAMTTSIDNPRLDFEINVVGGNNLLEAVRKYSSHTIVVYSSTNKVYGDMDWINYEETATRFVAKGFEAGFSEKLPLSFESPYGCSKGAIDQYMLDYARIFGIRTIVFRHSSIFGGRQFATSEQGWVGWFVKTALDIKKNKQLANFSISGNGKQVRDVLFSSDLVNCYFSAIKNIDITSGKAYNIGGGLGNSLSLIELFLFLENELSIEMSYETLPWRKSDQKVFIADIALAEKDFKWKPLISKENGLRTMVEWVKS